MSLPTLIKNIVEEESKKISVAFLATILSVSGNKAKIQPLGLVRDYGGTAQKQAPITNVHISKTALYVPTGMTDGEVKYRNIKKNDIVLCVCCDRNIDAALKGQNALPPVGYHNKSDCVIVAVI